MKERRKGNGWPGPPEMVPGFTKDAIDIFEMLVRDIEKAEADLRDNLKMGEVDRKAMARLSPGKLISIRLKNGRRSGPRNGNYTITKEILLSAKKNGQCATELAKKYGVNWATVVAAENRNKVKLIRKNCGRKLKN